MIKLLIVSGNPDPQQMAVVLLDNKIPSMQPAGSESFYELFEDLTGIQRQWIPFHKKISFFFDEGEMIGVYAIVLSTQTVLLKGEWVPIHNINNLSAMDSEIFQTAIFAI